MNNLFLTMELGISYSMKQNHWTVCTEKSINSVYTGSNISHCMCTDMKCENWTSIKDGYILSISNSWEIEYYVQQMIVFDSSTLITATH